MGMATKVQRADVVWDSDLTVSAVRGHAGGLRLVIEDYSPLMANSWAWTALA